MALRRSTKKRITVFDYVREHQGISVRSIIKNVIVKRHFKTRLPFSGEIKLSDHRLVTIGNGMYRKVFTDDYPGLEAAIAQGVSYRPELEKFKFYRAIDKLAE